MSNDSTVVDFPEKPNMPAVNGGMMEVAVSRQAQEVQAAMVVAKKFPRDQIESFNRIMQDCKRKSLAERAVYAYPRGDAMVRGPSIKLAETMARAWGNLDFGIIELDRKKGQGNSPGESVMMSYAWDLETNTRQTKVFTVKHWRDTKKGGYKLDDERDVYEMTANQAARRLRACILGVIPGDIVDAAVAQCTKTLESGQGPIIDRIRSMVVIYSEMGITQDLIEKRLKHGIELTTEKEILELGQIYTAIRDNIMDRADYFDVAATETAQATELNARLAAVPTPPQAAKAPEQPTAAVAAPEKETKAKKPKPEKAAAPVEPAKQEAPAPQQPEPAAVNAPSAAVTQPPVEARTPEVLPPEPGSFEAFENTKIPTPPPAPEAPEYKFNFGIYTGKTLSVLGAEALVPYLARLKAAPIGDPKISAAITAIEIYLRKGESV